MAVYTEVTSEQMTEFLKGYEIGTLQSFSGITGGVSNSNYRLETSRGSFIVTLFEERTQASDLPYFVELMEFLASQGITCPLPVRNRYNIALTKLAGRPCIIVTFLQGSSITKPTVMHCAQVGETLARLHRVGTGFPLERSNNMDLEQSRACLEAVQQAPEVTGPGYDVLLRHELDFLAEQMPESSSETRGLPSGVIHADLFPDNVFFLNDRLSGLIDFYFACDDFLAYDLAICLNAWCFVKDEKTGEMVYDAQLGQALIQAYEKVRLLEPPEEDAFPVLCRAAAVRFLLTRLYDQVHTDKDANVVMHNPDEFAHRLRFHQETGTFSDYFKSAL